MIELSCPLRSHEEEARPGRRRSCAPGERRRPWLSRATAGPDGPAPPRRPRSHPRPLAAALALALLAAFAAPAHAGGGGISLPVNQMLQNILDWLSGSMAVTLGTIALVAAAFVWMFLRHERGADFAFRALLGTAIAVGAASILTTLVGSGALL